MTGLISRKNGIEFAIREAMAMFVGRLKGHQVNYIDDANFDARKMLAKQIHGCKCLERRNISGAGHHGIGLRALVGRRPLPNSNSNGAMLDCGIHVEPLKSELFGPGRNSPNLSPRVSRLKGKPGLGPQKRRFSLPMGAAGSAKGTGRPRRLRPDSSRQKQTSCPCRTLVACPW